MSAVRWLLQTAVERMGGPSSHFPVAGVEKSSCELFRRGTAHDARRRDPEPGPD